MVQLGHMRTTTSAMVAWLVALAAPQVRVGLWLWRVEVAGVLACIDVGMEAAWALRAESSAAAAVPIAKSRNFILIFRLER